MFLSDTDILAELADGALSIDPLADIDLQVQPASVDLRLAPAFLRFDQRRIKVIDPEADADMRRYTTKQTISDTDSLVIHPGDFILASTVETVNIPPDLIGFVKGRSSIGRLGVIIHTAGLIDPGYTGQITLEITNIGSAPGGYTPLTGYLAPLQLNDRTEGAPYHAQGMRSQRRGRHQVRTH